MLKVIGALLLVSACGWGGLYYSRELQKRPWQIRQLINALQILEAEIKYSQSALRQAFYTLQAQVPKPTSLLFERLFMKMDSPKATLYELWKIEIETFVKETALKENELEILLQFGRTLGQHDCMQQEKHIRLALSHLERELKEAREKEKKYSGMARSLGFLSGLFILLILI